MRKCVICFGFLFMSSAVADESSQQLAVRVQRLEQQLSNSTLLEMLDTIERLQSDVQQLRGNVEEMQHKLETMEKRQQGLYLDLDKRLLALEGSDGTPPVPDQPGVGQQIDNQERVELPPSKPAQQPVAKKSKDQQTKPRTGNEESTYRQAIGLLKDGRYNEAVSGFIHVLENYPNGKYSGNAQYWLGESYYVTRDFDEARASFEKVVQDYPESSKVPDAMLKLGFIQYEKSDWKSARKSLKNVVKQYPESSAAGLAQKRLGLMKSEGR